tara:strand:- start:1121 stop:1252 length:132 start_codon:yes stop_codon:yes gene_type:complete
MKIFKYLLKNTKFWLPAVVIIFLVIFMIILSKFGFNPLGYVVY